MEFWGVEVKAGEPLTVDPIPGMVIHLSQACLGETKSKGNESVLLNVKVGDQKLVLGMLALDKYPQLSFDLVFEKQFELSHNWKNGSIHFCGYQTELGDQGDDDEFGEFDDSESEEEEPVPKPVVQNGKSDQKVEQANSAASKSKAATKPESSEKPKVKIAAPKKDKDDEDSDDDDEDDSSDNDDGGSDDDSDEDMLDGDDSDDDSDDESDEETPKKPEVSKKRANDAAAKTPVPAKKPKSDASPKSDGKKVGGHTATPYPTKKGGKPQATPATTDKPKQTPKSGGISCKSCSKTFGSEKALESHTKAKHA